jgi:hypothetical protein
MRGDKAQGYTSARMRGDKAQRGHEDKGHGTHREKEK